jgi:hypothetical protein
MIAYFSRWTLAVLAALITIGIGFGSASAAPAAKPTPLDPKGMLSHTYKLEQNRLKVQDMRLKNAILYAGKVNGMIAKLKMKNKDTAALEQAAATFRAEIAKARAEWQAASDTLTAHAGFDATGKVTNADQASATLKDAHGHIEQAHIIAHTAYANLHAAIATYRKAHREVKEPVVPVEP